MKKTVVILGCLTATLMLSACDTPAPLKRHSVNGFEGECPKTAGVLYEGASYCVGYGT